MARAPRDKQRGLAVLLALLLCAALNAIHMNNERSRGHDPVTGIVRDAALVPAQTATVRVSRWFKMYVVSIFQGPRLARQNQLLRDKVLALSEANKQLAGAQAENDRLRDLLDFQRKSPKPLLAAEVTALKPSPQTDTVVLNRGIADGVHLHSIVVAPNGALVGQVIDVSTHSSTALILTDENSSVGAQIVPPGSDATAPVTPATPSAAATVNTVAATPKDPSKAPAAKTASTPANASAKDKTASANPTAPAPAAVPKPVGVCRGIGGGQAVVTYLPSDAQIKSGDAVTTSGLGLVFPAGIPIGTVTFVKTDTTLSSCTATIRPAADLDHLDEAFILR